MSRIGLHLYFAPSFGGGERYLLTAAEALRSLGEVDFLCPASVDLGEFERGLALDLQGVRPVLHPRRRFHSYRDWLAGKPYDFFLALDNHLAPMQLSLGRRSVLHLQTPPYPPPVRRPWRGRLKLRSYDLVLCNSEYTRRWAQRHGTGGVPLRVVYPPIAVDLYVPLQKRPFILSVGRFFTGRHEKKHALMIGCFSELLRSGLEGWELHLAGSIRSYNPQDVAYLEGLRKLADGLPVRFHVNASLEEMRRLYGEASLYWHATGYDVEEESSPQHLEHFGMAVGEAMAAGAVPIVIRKGGLVEMVTDGETGFLWDTPADLVRLTRQVVSGGRASAEIPGEARRSVLRFSKDRFACEIRALAEELLGR